MSIHTYEVNDGSGVTCKECLKKKSVVVSNGCAPASGPSLKDGFPLAESRGCADVTGKLNGGAPASGPSLKDGFPLVESRCCAENVIGELNGGAPASGPSLKDGFPLVESHGCAENVTGRSLVNLCSSKTLNADIQNPDEVITEGDLKPPQLQNSGLVLLFEKKLSPSDSDPMVGHLMLPNLHAEILIGRTPGRYKSTPVFIKDMAGNPWKLTLRWRPIKKSRKYILDGTRKCCQQMEWNAHDILKFYRQPSNGNLIVDLEKAHENASA